MQHVLILQFAPVHGLVVSTCEPGRHWLVAPHAAHPVLQHTLGPHGG